jgi:hypothetical protein
MNDRKWIKEGMEVAERDNLALKMVVERLLKRTKKVATYKRDADGNIIYQNKVIMEGVECYWWGTEGEAHVKVKEKFHTQRLVPWEVAVKGKQAVVEWIEARG